VPFGQGTIITRAGRNADVYALRMITISSP
jgi:hypothetical protein